MEKDDRELQKKIQANYNIDLAHQLKIGNDRAARAIVRSLDDLKYEDTFACSEEAETNHGSPKGKHRQGLCLQTTER